MSIKSDLPSQYEIKFAKFLTSLFLCGVLIEGYKFLFDKKGSQLNIDLNFKLFSSILINSRIKL